MALKILLSFLENLKNKKAEYFLAWKEKCHGHADELS